MRKICFLLLLFILYFCLAVPRVNALTDIKQKNKSKALAEFLTKYKSPLSDYTDLIVVRSDENNIDWRLLTAISCLESGCGRVLPENSHNAYGWENGKRYFKNWEEGITVVLETLNHQYKEKWHAETPEQIGKYYAASPTWAERVNKFMNQIDNYYQESDNLELSL